MSYPKFNGDSTRYDTFFSQLKSKYGIDAFFLERQDEVFIPLLGQIMTLDVKYVELLSSPCGGICESREASSYHMMKERHLQVMWLEQKYFRSLSTAEGVPITILSPGIWNGEAGPDFLRAHVRVGDQELKGDIEIHLRDEGWVHHRHHLDKRYNQVILHVGYWEPKVFQPIKTAEGRQIPCTYLEKKLTISEARILKLIDLDLYPYKHFVGSGTCAHALFRRLPPCEITDLLCEAAVWRLAQKRQFLQAKIDHPSDYLAGGIAMSLGYRHNADLFLTLFFMLKKQPITDEASLFAYALGVCGFFKECYRKKWLHSIKYQSLARRYDAMDEAMKRDALTLNLERSRPANNPIRRLAILVKLILDSGMPSLYEKLKALWFHRQLEGQKRPWIALYHQFVGAVPAYCDPYWERHYFFEEQEQLSSIALLGNDLKREILVNVYLPFLFAEIEQSDLSAEKEAFYQFYSAIPASKTRKATYLMHRFFGDTQKGGLLGKASTQQGAYQLHKDFCLHFEASCVGCPFVERYNTVYKK